MAGMTLSVKSIEENSTSVGDSIVMLNQTEEKSRARPDVTVGCQRL